MVGEIIKYLLYPCIYYFYTLAERIMISVRSLQRSESVSPIENIYTLWGRKRLPPSLVYPFTLRVTGIVNIYSDLMGFQYSS